MFRLDPKALILVAAVLAVSVAATTSAPAARQTADQRLPTAAPAGQTTLYGHISSLVRRGGSYRLRFDPALWLTGLPAERACGCRPVPNDSYVVDESHRLLTYVVPSNAHATVLTGGAHGTPVTVSELAQIVNGKNPRHRRLSEPRAGFWIRVGFDYPSPALALDQQFQP